MWSITKELMKKSRRTLVPAGIAIAISSLFICATLLLGTVIDYASIRTFTVQFGGADYVADRDYDTADPYEGCSKDDTAVYACSLGSTGLAAIGDISGVDDVRYDVSSWDATALTQGGVTRDMMPVEMSAKGQIMPYTLADGAWPAAPGQATIDDNAAKVLGLKVGDTITLAGYGYGLLSGQVLGSDAPAHEYEAETFEVGDSQGNETSITFTAQQMEQLADLSDTTLTLTVTGILHDDGNIYSLNGGAIVLTPADMLTLTKAACASFPTSTSETPENIAAMTHDDLNVATTYFSVTPGADGAQVMADVAASLTGATVMTRREAADQRVREYNDGGPNVITMGILVFGVIAMFVAALVISNTFRVLVAQRRHTLALLRTIGSSKGQVRRSVLTEGALLGLAYSALGVAVAYLVIGMLDLANVTVAGTEIALYPSLSSVTLPIVFATIVTVIASSGAARAATRVSPMEAMRPLDTTETAGIKAFRAVVAVLFLLLGIACSAYAVVQARGYTPESGIDSSTRAAWVYIAVAGAICSFIGLAMSTQAWMPWLLSGLGHLASLTGPAATVAAANIRRNPRRVAATGTALLIGVTLVATVGTGASCAQATVDQLLDGHYSVDAEMSDQSDGTVSDAMLRAAKSTDGVASAVRVDTYTASCNDSADPNSWHGFYGKAYVVPDDIIGDEVKDVFGTHHLEDGVIYVSSAYTAWASNGFVLHDGDVKTFSFSTGDATYHMQADGSMSTETDTSVTKDLTVKVVDFGTDSASGAAMAISPATAATLGAPEQSQIWMRMDTTRPTTELMNGIQALGTAYPEARISGTFTLRQNYDRMIAIMMDVFIGLLSVAVVIALIGVANTLSLSVIERERESATLRAVGMTAGQLKASLVWEATLISLGASLVGLILGAFYGWMGVTTVLVGIGTPVAVSLNWGIYLGIVALSLAAALLSSVAPARRALRVPPVVALTDAD